MPRPADNGPVGLRIADRCGFCYFWKKKCEGSDLGKCKAEDCEVSENMVCDSYTFRESGAIEI